jgi:hypothetical protein
MLAARTLTYVQTDKRHIKTTPSYSGEDENVLNSPESGDPVSPYYAYRNVQNTQ